KYYEPDPKAICIGSIFWKPSTCFAETLLEFMIPLPSRMASIEYNLRSKTGLPRGASLTGRIFLKLIIAMLAILVVALVAVDLLVSKVAERNYISTTTRELGDKSRLLARFLDDRPEPFDQSTFLDIGRALQGRVTLIDHAGNVLRETDARSEQMENHRDRPEV